MPNRIQADTSLWEQVWEEYDRRQHAPQVEPAQIRPLPRPRRSMAWGRRLRQVLAAGIVASATLYAVLPVLAAARLGEALTAGDLVALADVVDWQRLPPPLDRETSLAIEQHAPAAAAFLTAMAREVSQGIATPEGLVGLVRDRLPMGQGVSGMAMIGAIQPIDGRRVRVDLHAPGQARQALTVTLALSDMLRMRWQVVAVEVPPALFGQDG